MHQCIRLQYKRLDFVTSSARCFNHELINTRRPERSARCTSDVVSCSGVTTHSVGSYAQGVAHVKRAQAKGNKSHRAPGESR